MRAVIVWAVFGGTIGLIGAAGGCSASGNEIPEDPVVVDAGKRPVIGKDNDPFDGATPNYDASTLFDSGTTGPKADSGPPAPQCTFQPNAQGSSCATGVDIGSVSGDTAAAQNSVTFTGTTSQWLVVTVTEDSSSLSEKDLVARIVLTGPAASNYDVFAYVDPSGTPSTRSCQTVSGQSNNAAGMEDSVDLTWDDNQVTQPNIDTRLVSIKVEHVTGPCGTGNEWTVTVLGKQ